jgi:MFS family permease
MSNVTDAANPGGYPSRSYAWTVVAILIATAVLSYTDRQVLSLLVDPIRAELHITDNEVSLLLGTAFAVVYGVAGIPLGWLADRTSRRNLIFVGVLVWSVGTLACGLSHSFRQLFAARIVVGTGEAVLSPAAISLISDYFPPSRRGTAVGFFLSGIAMGIGVAILIGGGVLHLVESGVLAGTPLASQPAWRLVLLMIGAPGLLWGFAILLIREPARRATEPSDDTRPTDTAPRAGATARAEATRSSEVARHGGAQAGQFAGTTRSAELAPHGPAPAHPSWRSTVISRTVPVYLVVAMASLVDNAVGGWAPTLLMREFGKDPAEVGVQLGLVLTAGFGGGVLIGGWLADRGRWAYKLGVCLVSSLLILPVSLLINVPQFNVVFLSIPLYFALSGTVTACGFSAILDVVPNRSRGLAMAISFFLNVALGAGIGPTAVSQASEHVFGSNAGLGPAITLTVAAGYAIAVVALLVALLRFRARTPSTHAA